MRCDCTMKALSGRFLALLAGMLLLLLMLPAVVSSAWGQSSIQARQQQRSLEKAEQLATVRGSAAATVSGGQAQPLTELETLPPALGQPVTLRLQGATLEEALRRVAEQTGLDFVYGQRAVATGTQLTMDLDAVPAKAALERVLRGSGRTLLLSESGQLILAVPTAVGGRSKTQAAGAGPGATPPSLSKMQKALPQKLRADEVMQGRIEGTVTSDASGEPIPGVNVLVEGTELGAATSADGAYEITGVEPGVYTVRASFIGYGDETEEGVEVEEGQTTTVDITMQQQAQGLDEVVVVGYGSQQRQDLTGSVSSVSSAEITESPSVSPLESLEGKVSGLNINNNSGRPGSDIRVNLRGFTSINASNDPLFVIDGVIGADPNFLNPNNIESVQVLKDASASAIYGTRAANGVVIIETKGGQPGDLQLSYSNNVGAATMASKIDLLNSTEFMNVLREAYQYDPDRAVPDFAEEYPSLFNEDGSPRYNTDWQEAATRTAFTQRHNLSVSGGGENATVNLSLGYQDVGGILLNTWLKKYSARLNSDLTLRSWLTLDANLAYNNTDENRIDDFRVGAQIPTRTMVEEFPVIPVRLPDGEYSEPQDYGFLPRTPRENTVKLLNGISRRHNNAQLLANADLTVDVTDHLSFETTLGVEREQYELSFYGGRDLYNYTESSGGEATVTNTDVLYWQTENFLTYDRTFSEDHDVTALLGASWSEETYENVSASAQGFSDDAYGYNNLGAASNPLPSSSYYEDEALNSYYARLNYTLRSRYLLTATGRFDGSSKFGSGNRYAFFPSVALGWRLSEESFLADAEALSNLKMRFSTGVTGNSSIEAYSALGATGNYAAIFDNERSLAVAQGTIPNDELRWEKTTQHNLGLDLSLFASRMTFTADVYLKNTEDLLLNNPLPSVSGYDTITENIGETRNYGFELSLQTQNIDGEAFRWSSSANFSANRNEVLALGDNDADIFPGPYFLGTTNILRVGESVGSFWGYVREGTWGTDEAQEAARYGRNPGDKKLRDLNGDGTINSSDQTIIGNAYPDFTAFLSNTFEYQNWSLGISIEASYGNDVLNLTHHVLEDRVGIANNFESVLDAWTPENQDTPISSNRIATEDRYLTQVDTRYVEDGSFIRGQNLRLSYTLGQEFTSRLGFQQARISANMQNLFLITGYRGYDPEVSTYGSTFAQGIEFFGYPKPRTFSLGIDLQF